MGNFWDLEIDKFSASINFPAQINKDNIELSLYAGILGSKDSNSVNYLWLTPNTLKIQSNRTILKKEGITLSAAFPKNILVPYAASFQDKYGFSVSDIILVLALPIILFIASLLLWKKHGKDIRLNRTIVPEFEIPENLSPMEMGSLLKKGGLDNNTIPATIIRLGFLGYLTIEKVDRKILLFNAPDYKLTRLEAANGNHLYLAEKIILNGLFVSGNEVFLSDLKNVFYKELSPISKMMSEDLKERGYIDKTGEKYKLGMTIAGIIVWVLGALSYLVLPALCYGLIISGFIVIIFAYMMGKLTPAGAELELRIKGFKLYMNTAEKYRSQFQEKEGALDKLLPYAILFGITTQWLKKMKDIYGEAYFNAYHPAFFVGATSLTSFENFSSTINDLSSSIASNISPSSSGAGGAGGAGGGAGGGGGGGW